MNVVDSVLDALDEPSEDRPQPLEEGQTPLPIADRYHAVSPSPAELTFIDGGNQEIIGAANFSLQKLRFAVVTYEGRERVDHTVEEFRVLVTSQGDRLELEAFSDHDGFHCADTDRELTTANDRVTPSSVAMLYRRLHELRLADQDGAVVVDGALVAGHEAEKPLLDRLDNVCGVAKTSGVVTEHGRVMAAVLDREGMWYYHPVFEGGTTVTFTRLHPGAEHVFRVDMKQFDDTVFDALATVSDDAVFPGYPYGLIEADSLARVSDDEARAARMRLMTEFGEDWNAVERYLHTRDAHEVLDSIG